MSVIDTTHTTHKMYLGKPFYEWAHENKASGGSTYKEYHEAMVAYFRNSMAIATSDFIMNRKLHVHFNLNNRNRTVDMVLYISERKSPICGTVRCMDGR